MVKDDIPSGGEAMYPLNAAFENNLPLIVVKNFLKGFHSQICMDPFKKVSVFILLKVILQCLAPCSVQQGHADHITVIKGQESLTLSKRDSLIVDQQHSWQIQLLTTKAAMICGFRWVWALLYFL